MKYRVQAQALFGKTPQYGPSSAVGQAVKKENKDEEFKNK